MTVTLPVGSRWLSIIGIGEDGINGLSPAARRILSQASIIVGGARHLALIGPTDAETMVWPTPFSEGIARIVARSGQPVCVVASGDPFLYGVGSILTQHIPPDEILCLPAPSSLSLAASRLGWALQDCQIVTLHGRPFERIISQLQPNARLLVLSWDDKTAYRLARLLVEREMGASRVVVLEALGGERERIYDTTASEFADHPIDDLNLVALQIIADPDARIIPLTPGIPDDWFESDGQLTKREIRAVTLSSLAPRRGELLWDVGAGAGSIAIEWMLADPQNRAVAIEASGERAARIARNAAALGVPDLQILHGPAPEALEQLAKPDAVFVGGGGPEVIASVYSLIHSGCRLVVNAVTIETQNRIEALQAAFGGNLLSIRMERTDNLGGYRAWQPARGVVQWTITKP